MTQRAPYPPTVPVGEAVLGIAHTQTVRSGQRNTARLPPFVPRLDFPDPAYIIPNTIFKRGDAPGDIISIGNRVRVQPDNNISVGCLERLVQSRRDAPARVIHNFYIQVWMLTRKFLDTLPGLIGG